MACAAADWRGHCTAMRDRPHPLTAA